MPNLVPYHWHSLLRVVDPSACPPLGGEDTGGEGYVQFMRVEHVWGIERSPRRTLMMIDSSIQLGGISPHMLHYIMPYTG